MESELNRILVLSGLKESETGEYDDAKAQQLQNKLKNTLKASISANMNLFKDGGKFSQFDDVGFAFTGMMTVTCAESGGPNPDDDGIPEHEYEIGVIISVYTEGFNSDVLSITCSDSEETDSTNATMSVNSPEEEIINTISTKISELEKLLDEKEEEYNPEYNGSKFNGNIRGHWYT